MKTDDKKNIHTHITKAAYIKFKIAAFERQLTTQDVFAGFVSLIAGHNERATKLLDDLALMKYQGTLKQHIDSQVMSEVDRDLLYELMESSESKK